MSRNLAGMKITPAQDHVLQHSFGLDKKWCGSWYRNRYVADVGSDGYAVCIELVELGLMQSITERIGFCRFIVTDAGKEYARKKADEFDAKLRKENHMKKTHGGTRLGAGKKPASTSGARTKVYALRCTQTELDTLHSIGADELRRLIFTSQTTKL